MKKRVSRDLIIFIILIPLFLWGSFELSGRLGGGLPDYSIINKSKNGLSIFYETLGELNLAAERSMRELTSENMDTLQIAAEGGGFDVNSEDVKDWVEGGGTLVYLGAGELYDLDYKAAAEDKHGMRFFKYGRGKVIAANAENLTNLRLIKDTEYAYRLYEVIFEYGDRDIYFNEAHLYSDKGGNSLWYAIPAEIKFVIYQLLLALAAFIYYRGKAFGKPIPLYEEVERSENEYLYSAAALYRAAGAWDIMLSNYYRSFLNVIPTEEENWLEYWEREKLPSLDKAKEVYDFINRKGRGAKAKEYIRVAKALERLMKILEKRREVYWKNLKKTL